MIVLLAILSPARSRRQPHQFSTLAARQQAHASATLCCAFSECQLYSNLRIFRSCHLPPFQCVFAALRVVAPAESCEK
jgi:hypothetical protein